jgi:hypothetical protein
VWNLHEPCWGSFASCAPISSALLGRGYSARPVEKPAWSKESCLRQQWVAAPSTSIGQKVVLGKIRLDDGDNAVFLVVTVKIL